MDRNLKFASSVIEYVTKENLYDSYWQKVDDHVFYSKIICCLCTLNEMFADEVDDAIYMLEESEEAVRIIDSIYGEVLLTKDTEEHVAHVSLIAEGSQTVLPKKERPGKKHEE